MCVLACALLLVSGRVASAAPTPPSLDQQAELVDRFTNSVGAEVPYRRGWHAGGSTGFGRDKVVDKHGITNSAVVGAVVRAPQEVRQEGVQWVHEKAAILYRVFGESETVTVRVVINYSGWSGPGPQGVVTAYCVGYAGLCPEWINTAFSVD